MYQDILGKVRRAAKKNILYMNHAIRQMCRADRMITTEDVEYIIFNGEIIEDYPEDERGHSCLVFGISGQPIHIVCSPKSEYLAIITTYIPDSSKWRSDFKERI